MRIPHTLSASPIWLMFYFGSYTKCNYLEPRSYLLETLYPLLTAIHDGHHRITASVSGELDGALRGLVPVTVGHRRSPLCPGAGYILLFGNSRMSRSLVQKAPLLLVVTFLPPCESHMRLSRRHCDTLPPMRFADIRSPVDDEITWSLSLPWEVQQLHLSQLSSPHYPTPPPMTVSLSVSCSNPCQSSRAQIPVRCFH
jgi:hypothetical protein